MGLKKMIGLATIAVSLVVAGSVVAADTVRIGSMPVGSGWYVAAAAMEQVLKPVLGGRDVEVIARGGGVANPMVVEQGKAEIALSNVATSVWAMNGQELYAGKKATRIRALIGGLNPVYMAMMVRNDFIKKTGLDTMDKIFSSGKPLRIVMKPQGSNVPPTVDMIFAAYGLDRAKIKANGGEIIQVDTAQIPGCDPRRPRRYSARHRAQGTSDDHGSLSHRRCEFRRSIRKSEGHIGEERREARSVSAMVQGPERSDLGCGFRHGIDCARRFA